MEFFELKRVSVQIVLPSNYFVVKVEIRVNKETDLRLCEDNNLFEALNLAMYCALVCFFPWLEKIELGDNNGFSFKEAEHLNKILLFLKTKYEELIAEKVGKVA